MDTHDASDHRDAGKRGRGFTTSGGQPSLSHVQRPNRAYSTRSPDTYNGLDHTFDSASMSAHLHNRHISSPTDNALLRAQSFSPVSHASLALSPDALSPTEEGAFDLESKRALNQHGVNGLVATPTNPISIPLRRVATSESINGSFVGAQGPDSSRADSRMGRLNRQSLRRDGPTRSASRRPSNTPADIQTVGDFAQEHLFSSVRHLADP